ncbi:MAG: hypothetical protein OER82_05310 [Nitrosopumilus sp.]|nr:hypothetical protein [Nitrosopumilus sp.]
MTSKIILLSVFFPIVLLISFSAVSIVYADEAIATSLVGDLFGNPVASTPDGNLLVGAIRDQIDDVPTGSAYLVGESFPQVSTRGHFEYHIVGNPTLTEGHDQFDYDTLGEIPGIDGVPATSDLVIYIHGFNNSPQSAVSNFSTAQTVLDELGYTTGSLIGYSWDSSGIIPIQFPDATFVAQENG